MVNVWVGLGLGAAGVFASPAPLRSTSTPPPPPPPFAGGVVLGLSTTLWLHTSGQVTGISGFLRGVLDPAKWAAGGHWRPAWLAAFTGVAALLSLAAPTWVGVGDRPDATPIAYVLGGALVGLGTSMSNGCTSGHGICGLARFSLRSMTAVMTFMMAAVLTATLLDIHRPALLVEVPTPFPALAAAGSGVPNGNTPLFAAIFGALCLAVVTALAGHAAYAVSSHEAAHTVLAAAAGGVFAAGMAVGGMLNRSVIISFLAGTAGWSPRLAAVMGGGVLVAGAAFYWVKVRHQQLLAGLGTACPAGDVGEGFTPDERKALTFLGRAYRVPTNTLVNFQLVLGAVLFGVGWGISGLCPGPALGIMAAGSPRTWLWLPGFALGVGIWVGTEHRLAQAAAAPAPKGPPLLPQRPGPAVQAAPSPAPPASAAGPAP